MPDTRYYTYRHVPGYGRDDHMAPELIARAARRLGLDTDQDIREAVGLASHPVPMRSCAVRLPVARGAKAHMARALRLARHEIRRSDCWVAIIREEDDHDTP